MAVKRLKATVYGRVQGVGFRWFTRELAEELELTGYVMNTSDGGVETVAEGEEGRLARFLGLLRRGPSRSEVTYVESEYSAATGEFGGFRVRRY